MPVSQINGASIETGSVLTADLADAAVTSAKLASAATPIGVGQTWTDVKASRATDVTYTNSTGRPIMVAFTPNASGSMYGYARINGANILYQQFTPSGGGGCASWTFIVPPGATYLMANLSNMGGIAEWQELR